MVAHNFRDRTGETWGSMTIIGQAPTRRRKNRLGRTKSVSMWYVKCTCGYEQSIPTTYIGQSSQCFKCKYDNMYSFSPGDTIGCLTILERCPIGTVGKSYTTYKTRCKCGRIRYDTNGHLKQAPHETCACGYERHGLTSKRPENKANNMMYRQWSNIKDRCYNQNCHAYKHYGGRGIKVCDRWLTFKNFLEDMGYKQKGLSLDRIDPDGDYSPENCRWANNRTQSLNRGFNKVYKYNGESMTLGQWMAKIQLDGEVVSLPDCKAETARENKAVITIAS